MPSSSRPAAAIVTGHSRGLGAAIVRELLGRDIPVLGISRSGVPERKGLSQAQVDLSDDAALHGWLGDGEPLRRFLGGAARAILVNNAGLLEPIGRMEQQDPAAVSRTVAVNLGAALALSASFTRVTEGIDDRRIVHVSSGAARHAYAGWSVYCATKAALDHHARAVALDKSPGLRIASVAPGVIDTDMQALIRRTPADHFPDRDRFVEMQKKGALRSPDEAAAALVNYLLSSEFGAEPVSETRR